METDFELSLSFELSAMWVGVLWRRGTATLKETNQMFKVLEIEVCLIPCCPLKLRRLKPLGFRLESNSE